LLSEREPSIAVKRTHGRQRPPLKRARRKGAAR